MARKIVSAAQMREIDRRTIEERGIPGLQLMEKAGDAVARAVMENYRPLRVGILTGKGNNGGDGLVAARRLAESGIEALVWMFAPAKELGGDAAKCHESLSELEGEAVNRLHVEEARPMESLRERHADCDVLVDALLGTGISGPVREPYAAAIEFINAIPEPVVAVDIPSGLDADTGHFEGTCVVAERTVTMGLPKLGLVAGVGPVYTGQVEVAPLDFPEDLLEDPAITTALLELEDCEQALPLRRHDGHKGTFGSLLVVAGGPGMSGAAYLTTATALRSGAGMVYAAFPEECSRILESRLIEAIKLAVPGGHGQHLTHEAWDMLEPHLNSVHALALGPGIGTDPDTARLVDELVCREIPMVIDADGLNCLGGKSQYLTERKAPTVMTPHPGEMARLLGVTTEEVQTDRIGVASRFAREAEVVVVLKGAGSVVAAPDGRVFINPTGNNGMAKGGSGDVLTGLIGGLLAQGCGALEAACAGVYLHGLAGDYAKARYGLRAMRARDILDSLPEALELCE